jgi:hypothetical protein
MDEIVPHFGDVENLIGPEILRLNLDLEAILMFLQSFKGDLGSG